MIGPMLLLAVQAAASPATPPRAPCTPAQEAAATPAGWARPLALRSGATLVPGRAATLALLPAEQVRFRTPPERAAASGSRAGVATVLVARGGTWRVALDQGVWIDVVDARGRPVVSAAHGHGATCSGVRKQVDFALPAGRYEVQLSGARAAAVRVMVTRVGAAGAGG